MNINTELSTLQQHLPAITHCLTHTLPSVCKKDKKYVFVSLPNAVYTPMTTDYYMCDHELPITTSCHLLRISLTESH